MQEANNRPPAETHCPYCALQCGMTLTSTGDRLEVTGRDFSVNRGNLCRKGWTAADLLDAPDRLLGPLVRPHKGAPLVPASWEEAIAFTTANLRRAQDRHGRD